MDRSQGRSSPAGKGGSCLRVQRFLRWFRASDALSNCRILIVGKVGGDVSLFVARLRNFLVDVVVSSQGRAGFHPVVLHDLGFECEHSFQGAGRQLSATLDNDRYRPLHVVANEANCRTSHLFFVKRLKGLMVDAARFGQSYRLRIFKLRVGYALEVCLEDVGRVDTASGLFRSVDHFMCYVWL